MRFIINGQEKEISENIDTLDDLLRIQQIDYPVATAVNEVFVRLQEREGTHLKEGDRIEILVPREGG